MPQDRAEELWAQQLISRELVCVVHRHDDGREDGQFDLRIGPVDALVAAIEVTTAIDPDWIAAWKAGPQQGKFTIHGVRGDWIVGFSPKKRVNIVLKALSQILPALEAQGAMNIYTSQLWRPGNEWLIDSLDRHGIDSMHCYRRDGSGSVSLTLPGCGGAVDSKGEALPGWVASFLQDAERVDVLRKLCVDACERHVFIIADLVGAPWQVVSYLTQWGHDEPKPPTPSVGPTLPEPVTHVWVVCTFGRFGVRWDGESWLHFDARPELIESPDAVG